MLRLLYDFDSHRGRGGGIVFLIIPLILITFFKFNYSIYLVIIPLAIAGFYDDIFSLKSLPRFIIQLITVNVIILLFLNQISLTLNLYIFVFLLLIGTSIINFANFIDGIDGLLCSLAIIFFVATTLILKTNTYMPLIGSLSSFYIFNRHPAKVFMGDVGSTLIGSLIFYALINSNNYLEFTKLLLIISPIVFDCISCILIRIIKKENIFKPHSLHLYQRLVKNGISHNKVTYIYSISSILIAFSAYFFPLKVEIIISIIVFILGIYLNYKKACPIYLFK